MAGDIRTLTMKILANTGDFSKGLKDAENSTDKFSKGIGGLLGSAAKGFGILTAAVNGTAFAIGVSAVKAAVEAQKEDALLEQSIKNLTSATDAQIKKTFEYLDAAEDAAGVNSDQLKPSFERILRTVKDLSKAQEIQRVAQDVAAGTGKSLTEVADALSRAYEGNVKGLKDLGVKLETTRTITKKVKVSKDDLTKAELSSESAALAVQKAQERLNKVLGNSKSDALDVAQAQNALERAQLRAADSSDTFEKKQKNVGKSISETKEVARPFEEILKDLSKQYEGAAATAAETYAGKLEQIRTAFGKIKEDLGMVLFPALERLTDFVQITILPAFKDFVAGLTGGQPTSVKNALRDAKGRVEELSAGVDQPGVTGGYSLGASMRRLADTVSETSKQLFGATGNESGFKQLLDVLTAIVNATNLAITGITNVRNSTLGEALLPSRTPQPGLVGIPKLIAESALVQSTKQLVTGQGLGQGVVVNQNVYYGSTNSTSTARTVTSSINKAISLGVSNKLKSNTVLR